MADQFRIFLSHSYKAKLINLYFYRILSDAMEVQFEVDEGKKQLSVTRLERMIRECDGFMGIYPLAEPIEKVLQRTELLNLSRYFRLELELASRSTRPMLVYADQRFKGVLNLPSWTRTRWYDVREILAAELYPSREEQQAAVEPFKAEVIAYKKLRLCRGDATRSNKVAIVLAGNSPETVYTTSICNVIEELVEAKWPGGADFIFLPDPRRRKTMIDLEAYDFVVADVGMHAMRNGIVGYLHARFVPAVRLLHTSDKGADALGAHRMLHADIEVGYDKDLVVWGSEEDLRRELILRLNLISPAARLITSAVKAEEYFGVAEKRKEAVFFSYSSGDAALARRISDELKKNFQDVFDYKDGESIRPGHPWIDEIGASVQRSVLGVQIISLNYLRSGNCMQEARMMNTQQGEAKMRVIRVKVTDERLELPAWMGIDQYVHAYRDDDVEPAVAKILAFARS